MVHGAVQALRSVRAHLRDPRQGDGDRRSPSTRRKPGRRHFIGTALVSVVLLTAGTCKQPPHGISDVSETFEPRGVPWNGVKVYLSSPRHASSGERGECGWEENINGRIFNLYAADLNDSADTLGTLTTRGYEARVSPNSRDDGWRLNRDESNNWGANVHIVTHTNAFVGCDNAAQYLLVMFKSGDANSIDLKDNLLQQLDPQVPGGQNSWNCDNLGECAANAAHIAYIELFFHTNQAATDWFIGPGDDPQARGGMDASPYLGVALDEHLGYPRATAVSTTSLDQYTGFGQSPDAALRDETIAYWEAFEREQLVRECMARVGLDYAPAVAFPTGDMLDVAENLGIQDQGSSPDLPGFSSPTSWNRDYERGLSGGERERYNQTLLGESVADVVEADRTGIVPDGRRAEEFATGGCFGEAKAAIPSIWDAQRNLGAEMDAMRQEVAGSAEMRETAGVYAECAEAAGGVTASGPSDLEELIAGGGARADAAATAYDDCAPVWAAGYERAATAAADRFVARHGDQLDTAARRYDGVMDQIAQDQDLATYLAAQVAGATSAKAPNLPAN
jgi:hypothetical protein